MKRIYMYSYVMMFLFFSFFLPNNQQLKGAGPGDEATQERNLLAFWKEVERRVDKQLAKLDERFDELERKSDERFDELERKSDERFDELDEQLDKLERKSDERFDELDEQLDKLDERIDKLEKDYRQGFVAQKILSSFMEMVNAGEGDAHQLLEEKKRYCFLQGPYDFTLIDYLKAYGRQDLVPLVNEYLGNHPDISNNFQEVTEKLAKERPPYDDVLSKIIEDLCLGALPVYYFVYENTPRDHSRDKKTKNLRHIVKALSDKDSVDKAFECLILLFQFGYFDLAFDSDGYKECLFQLFAYLDNVLRDPAQESSENVFAQKLLTVLANSGLTYDIFTQLEQERGELFQGIEGFLKKSNYGSIAAVGIFGLVLFIAGKLIQKKFFNKKSKVEPQPHFFCAEPPSDALRAFLNEDEK